MSKTSLVLLSSLLLLASCKVQNSNIVREPQQLPPAPVPVQQLPPTSQQGSSAPAQAGRYTDYYDGVIGNGQESVLFFSSSTCAPCQTEDGLLRTWFAGQSLPLSVYKVDYDSATALNARFNITLPDTYVKIDGEGYILQMTTAPVPDQLQLMVSSL